VLLRVPEAGGLRHGFSTLKMEGDMSRSDASSDLSDERAAVSNARRSARTHTMAPAVVDLPLRGNGADGPVVSVWPSPSDVRVSVVIPTLNEAENLPHVFARLPDKGDALATGFAACTGDIIVMLDADGSTDAGEIPRFVAALRSGADFVKGSRFAQGGSSSDITPFRRAGNRGLNLVVNALYGTKYTDLCYGYNAFWIRCLPYLRVDCSGFEVETLINVRIAKAGLVIHEVPSFEHDRIHGRSNLNPIRDGGRVLRTIALERVPALRRGLVARAERRQLAE
jgi:hypothetical protein